MLRRTPCSHTTDRYSRCLVFLLVAVGLASCSSGIERAVQTQFQVPQFDDPGEQAGGLNVKLSSEAKDDATDNLKFNQNDLEATIRRALLVNDLLAEQYDSGLPTIEITVTAVRVRSSFSAIMFGFMAGDDHIEGDVVVRATDGNVLQKFSVSASYALGGLAGGQDDARLSWLYETFAEHVTEELTGQSEEQLENAQAMPEDESAIQSEPSGPESEGRLSFARDDTARIQDQLALGQTESPVGSKMAATEPQVATLPPATAPATGSPGPLQTYDGDWILKLRFEGRNAGAAKTLVFVTDGKFTTEFSDGGMRGTLSGEMFPDGTLKGWGYLKWMDAYGNRRFVFTSRYQDGQYTAEGQAMGMYYAEDFRLVLTQAE